MGAGNSKQSVLDVDTSQLNKNMFEHITNTQTKQSTNITTIQAANISNVKNLSCDLDITQDAEIKLSIIQEFDSDSADKLRTVMNSSLDESIDKELKMESGALSLSFGDNQSSINKIKNRINNIIETKITKDYLNEQINIINSIQTLGVSNVTFDPCGYSLYPEGPPEWVVKSCDKTKKCNISQTMLVDMFVEQLSTIIIKTIKEDEQINDIVQDLEFDESMTTSGLLDIFKNPWVIMALIFVAIAVIAYKYMPSAPASGPATGTATGTATLVIPAPATGTAQPTTTLGIPAPAPAVSKPT